jgi:hypothetical protein
MWSGVAEHRGQAILEGKKGVIEEHGTAAGGHEYVAHAGVRNALREVVGDSRLVHDSAGE